MTLIDAGARRGALREDGPGDRSSGGSAGNTMAGIASLGGTRRLYRQGARRSAGRRVPPRHHRDRRAVRHAAADAGPGTARCLILVTPDGQRTMATYLGACVELGPDDIDTGTDRRGEGDLSRRLLWDPPRAKQAFRRAPRWRTGRPAGLADPLRLVLRRPPSRRIPRAGPRHVDILFANEAEISSLYQVDLRAAAAAARGHARSPR